MYIWDYIKKIFNYYVVNLFNLDDKNIENSDIYLEDIIEILNDI